MPSPPAFGTRFFVILIVRALTEYLRHKPNIDGNLNPTIVAALGVLVDNIDVILAENPPGPE